MNQVIINKGKLLKGDKVFIDYIKNDNSETEPADCSEKHKTPPHKDLRNAFANLAIHAALNNEFIDFKAVKDIENIDPELINNFSVTGFTMVGDDEGVIITARKTLKNKKTFGFNTTIISFNDEVNETGDTVNNSYPFVDNLIDAIENCKDELRLYLNGKHGEKTVEKVEKDPNQLELEIPQ